MLTGQRVRISNPSFQHRTLSLVQYEPLAVSPKIVHEIMCIVTTIVRLKSSLVQDVAPTYCGPVPALPLARQTVFGVGRACNKPQSMQMGGSHRRRVPVGSLRGHSVAFGTLNGLQDHDYILPTAAVTSTNEPRRTSRALHGTRRSPR